MTFYGTDLPAPGVYAFGEGNYPPADAFQGLWDMVFGVGRGVYGADAPLKAGAVRLELDEVLASPTVYHPIHGRVDATLMSDPSHDAGDVLHVHATF